MHGLEFVKKMQAKEQMEYVCWKLSPQVALVMDRDAHSM